MNDRLDGQVKGLARAVSLALACVSTVTQMAWPAHAADPFTKITDSPVVTEIEYSWTCAWGDYDNDGFPDLFVGNSYKANNSLFHNNGDGTFTKVTNSAVGDIVTDIVNCHGCAWGDYNNDGFVDMIVSQTNGKLRLYKNNGDGTFTGVNSAGSGDDSSVFNRTDARHTVAWADYDNDGLLDFAVVVHGPNGRNRLYHNNGDGTFTEARDSVISQDPADWDGLAWGDYDNDGYPDLFVANFGGTNILYHNNGDGTFTKVAGSVVGRDEGSFAGAAWGDYDNDGYLDLFVSCQDSGPNLLFHNNGDGTFTKITNGPIANGNHGRGCVWGDYDNDGWLDLFVNRGSPYGSGGAGETNALYQNNGDGTFTEITNSVVVADVGQGQACAWGDYDNDGFPDLFVANGGFLVGLHKQANFLYRNNGNSNNWIVFTLAGTVSNRSAVGAKVRLKARIAGKVFWQMREISGGGNGGGQNDLRASFGLGDATLVDTVRIEWPSGTVQELHNLGVKQFLTVTEPNGK
jgi:hypothetical protein